MNGNEIQVGPQGWWNTIKEKLGLDNLKDKKDILIEIILYGAIGFLTGFLFKRFSFIVALVVLIVAILIVLQQFNFLLITINWAKVNEVLGIQPAPPGETVFGVLWEWIKANRVISVSFIIGFFLGLKVG